MVAELVSGNNLNSVNHETSRTLQKKEREYGI
jgi:hypothetical protein